MKKLNFYSSHSNQNGNLNFNLAFWNFCLVVMQTFSFFKYLHVAYYSKW